MGLERQFEDHEAKDEVRFAHLEGKIDLIHQSVISMHADVKLGNTQWKRIGAFMGTVIGGIYIVLSWWYQ